MGFPELRLQAGTTTDLRSLLESLKMPPYSSHQTLDRIPHYQFGNSCTERVEWVVHHGRATATDTIVVGAGKTGETGRSVEWHRYEMRWQENWEVAGCENELGWVGAQHFYFRDLRRFSYFGGPGDKHQRDAFIDIRLCKRNVLSGRARIRSDIASGLKPRSPRCRELT